MMRMMGIGFVAQRGAVCEAEGGEFRIGHPKGFLRGVGSGTEARDPVEVAARLPRAAAGRRLRADGGGDESEDLALVEPAQAHVLIDVPGAGGDVCCEVAGAADGAEAEGGGGEALGGAELGEGVEEGGGGAVGGLAVVAEEGGEGAEQEEEVEVGEGAVDVPGAGDFGRDDRGVLFVG